MRFRLYNTLRNGRDYGRVWPAQPELNSVFPENKVIRLTSLGFRYLPILAILTAMLQFSMLGMAFLPQILAMMLFLLSLPLHGWYWLGVRASTPLPPGIASWYQQIRTQMQTQGIEVIPARQPGRYLDLALLLKQAYQQLDKAFVREWF
ncbi:terminus macrodomain insulation protein YfbV [Chromatiaceae bacterium AAb-1]|nr:terminus macrodomain insulation protein YfbV [Chromatiaceae bacterium AAb-1]